MHRDVNEICTFDVVNLIIALQALQGMILINFIDLFYFR